MKWQHYLTSVCFAFLGLFAGSFIINQNKASAVSDYTVSVPTNSSMLVICDNNSNNYINCSDFKYLIIDSSSIYSSLNQNSYANVTTSTSSFNVSLDVRFGFSSKIYYYINNNLRYFRFTSFSSYFPADSSITITLTESLDSSAPSGSLSITENGTYDVTNYAEAVVNVPNTETIIQGDYHDDLVSINNSIMVCAGVCLVLYFFYCIYRMFIKAGGK